MTDLAIRLATASDAATVLRFIQALADYEKLSHMVVATEDAVRATLFGPRPAAEVLFAERGGAPVGFALFFQSYSTFLAKPGLYLEDLFVMPQERGRGAGLMLMTALAKLCVERDYGRFEWAVLDWNAPSIEFYKRLGAVELTEWNVMRLVGDPLVALAEVRRASRSES